MNASIEHMRATIEAMREDGIRAREENQRKREDSIRAHEENQRKREELRHTIENEYRKTKLAFMAALLGGILALIGVLGAAMVERGLFDAWLL